VSMAAAAVRLSRRIFEDLREASVLFVGAGEMIELVATHFAARSPRSMAVANRTLERGESLAARFGAHALRLSDLPTRLQRLIRTDVQGLHAYAVQPSAGLIKLDAMENPHRLPQPLQTELGRRLGALALNRYPGERIGDLRAALAAYAGLPVGFDLMLGNGSDELIALIALACDVPGAGVLAPVPGFVMYAMSAQLQGLRFTGVPLTVCPLERLGARRCEDQTVARHDRNQLRAVWRPSGIDDVGDVAKVLRTDIRCQGDECARFFFMRIAESVHGTFGRTHPVTRTQVARNVID